MRSYICQSHAMKPSLLPSLISHSAKPLLYSHKLSNSHCSAWFQYSLVQHIFASNHTLSSLRTGTFTYCRVPCKALEYMVGVQKLINSASFCLGLRNCIWITKQRPLQMAEKASFLDDKIKIENNLNKLKKLSKNPKHNMEFNGV